MELASPTSLSLWDAPAKQGKQSRHSPCSLQATGTMQMAYYFDLSGACPGIHKWPFDFLDRTPMDEYAPRWSILYSHGAVDSQDDLNMAPNGSSRRPKPQLRPPLFPPSPPPSPPCARYQRPFSPDHHHRRRSPVRRAHNLPGNRRTQLTPAEPQFPTPPRHLWPPPPEQPGISTGGGSRGRRPTREPADSQAEKRVLSHSMGPPPLPTSRQNTTKARSWTPAGSRTGHITICHIPTPPKTASPCSPRHDTPARGAGRSGSRRRERAALDPFPRAISSPRDEGPPPFVDMSRKPAYRERSDSAASSSVSLSGVSFSVAGSVRSPANGQLSGPAEPPPPARHIPAARSHVRALPPELLGLGHALRKKPAICDLKEANDDRDEVWAWAVTAEMYALQRRRR